MKTSTDNSYSAMLKQYARELSTTPDFTTVNGMSVSILNTILELPPGQREEQFVKYALESDRLLRSYRHAA